MSGLAALRMAYAQTATGDTVHADHIDTDAYAWPTPLACLDPRCHCQVQAVHSGLAEKGRVRAHFRRWPGHVHVDGCSFHAQQRVDQVLQLGITQRHRGVYRVVMPQALHHWPPRDPQRSAPSKHRYYEALDTLVNTAAIVADLLQCCANPDGSDPSDHFELRCADRRVHWLNFCYTEKRAITLAGRLYRKQQLGKSLPHPVALVLTVHDIHRPHTGRVGLRGRVHSVPFEINGGESAFRLRSEFRLSNPAFAKPYHPGEQVLAFGIPRLNLRQGWAFLDLDIIDDRQLTHLSRGPRSGQ